MTSPAHGGVSADGSVPTTAVTVPLGRDAQAQANAGEATLIGTNQDVSTLGAGDAASGLTTQRSNTAMAPGAKAFTDED